MTEPIYALCYSMDEVTLKETVCKQPGLCTCHKDDKAKCGYTVKEARALITKYYRDRADYVAKCTDAEFLHDYGVST